MLMRPAVALTTIDVARRGLLSVASFLVAEDTVDAAFLVAKTQGRAGRAAARATALAAPDRAARLAVGVLALDTDDTVAAPRSCLLLRGIRGTGVTKRDPHHVAVTVITEMDIHFWGCCAIRQPKATRPGGACG